MMDRLRKRVRDYGYLSDGTFSGSIAKITEGALIYLVEELIPAETKNEINIRLVEAGRADLTVSGVIKAMLGKISKKAFDEVGEQGDKAIGEEITKVFIGGWKDLKPIVRKGVV